MNPFVKKVEAIEDYRLSLEFENGDLRIFDAKPYLSRGVFSRLRNIASFRAISVVSGSVEWNNGLDLSYDTLYIESRPISPENLSTVSEISE